MAGFGDHTDLPKLTAALLDGGFDHGEVERILGGNALRLLARVDADARRAPS
jgi:microsomal dipeptidase-like Zn-dependent dipeptidase